MKYIEQAIKEAVEKGGYKNPMPMEGMGREMTGLERQALQNYCLLDPLFWQALGKARGWEGMSGTTLSGRCRVFDEKFLPEWAWNMHRFIDHLAAKKSAESFFQELQS